MTLEIVLAVVIIIAAAMQVAVLYLLYRVISRLADRTERLLTKVEPEIAEMAEGVRSFRAAVEHVSGELDALLTGVRATTDELSEIARTETRELARVTRKTAETAERQIEAFSDSLDRARVRVAEIGEGFDRGVLEPARMVLAVAAGFKRGVEALVAPRSPRTSKASPPADPWGDPGDV